MERRGLHGNKAGWQVKLIFNLILCLVAFLVLVFVVKVTVTSVLWVFLFGLGYWLFHRLRGGVGVKKSGKPQPSLRRSSWR